MDFHIKLAIEVNRFIQNTSTPPNIISINKEDLLMLENKYLNGTNGFLTFGGVRTFQGIRIIISTDLPRGKILIGFLT